MDGKNHTVLIADDEPEIRQVLRIFLEGERYRVLEAADGGNERAKLAVDVFVTGIVHYIGAFFLDLGGLTDLVFTAGIGEHSDFLL